MLCITSGSVSSDLRWSLPVCSLAAAMLPVDGDKLKVWLEDVALPKVSDADPAALSEYIVLLLDSIDLTYLDNATKQQCVGKLHEFFETHTESFVDELFIYIAKHRQPAAAPQPPPSSHRHSSSSTTASHRDSRRRRSRSRSRSPSPSTSRSRSRSRSPDRRRRRSRDEQDEEYKRRDRDSRDDRSGRGGSGRGSELVRDWRFSGGGRGGDGGRGRGDRSADGKDRRQVERRDYRSGTSSDSWQPVHHVVTDRRSRPSPSPPLLIQRPYVPPSDEQQNDEAVRPPRRTVVMPASNPFSTSALANHTTTSTDAEPATGAVRVGHHTIVKRKRVEDPEAATPTLARTHPPATHTGAAATLLLSNAPRFVLNFKLLMEHFGQFGAIMGMEIQEAAGTATVKYGTAEDVLSALTGPPLHPQARLTVLPAQQLHTPSNIIQSVAEQEQDGEQDDQEEQLDTHTPPNGTNHSLVPQAHSSAPATTLSVGKHTITLKPKTSPSPPAAQSLPSVQPAAPTEPPAVGSALHTAQLIRQQKQTQQAQQQQPTPTPSTQPTPPTAQPNPTPTTTPPSAAASPSTTVTAPSAPLSAAEKEHRTAVKKLQLLQAQIDQQERLMQRLDAAMAEQVAGSVEYNALYGKKLDFDMALEETRRKWREARGKVVMLAIKVGNAPAAAPSTLPPAADNQSGGAAIEMAM